MAEEVLRIDFRDVGQGDCSVITLPNGKVVLIDVGPAGNPVASWIAGPPVRVISDVILTHNDADHAGALPTVVELGIRQSERFKLWLLRDRDGRGHEGKKMERIFAKAAEAEDRGLLETWHLDRKVRIWEGSEHVIEVLFPTAVQSVLQSPNPNESSAIIALIRADGGMIIWPGDNLLQQVAKRTGKQPFLLHGPHHGAPGDLDFNDFGSSVASLSPKFSFLSVGSQNRYQHPNPRYVKALAASGSCVSCSGLNKQCDKNFDTRVPSDHVLNGSLLLGLGRAASAIACRGSMTIWSKPSGFENDEWHEEHIRRKTKLGRAKCII